MGIQVTGNSRIDGATAEIATHIRDARVGKRYREQDHYDEAMRLRDEILAGATELAYDPVSGANWDQAAAVAAWGRSMERSSPRWVLHGKPDHWYWVFFNFGPWTGQVTIRDTGFIWATYDYDTGEQIHSGVTTSIYVAYNSVERNEEVARPQAQAG